MGLLARIAARFGVGEDDALSVPPMDGVLKPDNRLETSERLLTLPGADNLAVLGETLLVTGGSALHRFDPTTGATEEVRDFGGPVTMVATSPGGQIAVGVEGIGVELRDVDGQWRRLELAAPDRDCVTAGLFRGEGGLVLAIGSRRHPASAWKRDLMSRGASGAVVGLALATGAAETIADGLAWPYGLAEVDGRVLVAESWRHRILRLPGAQGEANAVALGDLPAYPARLAPASGGGLWIALFAPRRQLTELVLREDDYRREMMATIPAESWIGPDFADGGGVDQPLQAGSVRQMGIMKPWAPSRSYGLVARLGADLAPVESYHSRADGRMHGIASAVELGGRLYAASRGAGILLRLDPSRRGAP